VAVAIIADRRGLGAWLEVGPSVNHAGLALRPPVSYA
jgi:hypothetical protein